MAASDTRVEAEGFSLQPFPQPSMRNLLPCITLFVYIQVLRVLPRDTVTAYRRRQLDFQNRSTFPQRIITSSKGRSPTVSVSSLARLADVRIRTFCLFLTVTIFFLPYSCLSVYRAAECAHFCFASIDAVLSSTVYEIGSWKHYTNVQLSSLKHHSTCPV